MKRQQDHYTRKAKSMGYPARSIFKLEEIDNKFRVLTKGPILDIGAAPGSWSLYCLRKGKTPVVSVDLNPLEINRPGLKSITGDINHQDVQKTIKDMGPYATVISDAAPSTTGNRLVDSARSYELSRQIILVAFEMLKSGGNFVCKIFQGGDEPQLLELLRTRFEKVKSFKPKASRDESFEIFFIAAGYKE